MVDVAAMNAVRAVHPSNQIPPGSTTGAVLITCIATCWHPRERDVLRDGTVITVAEGRRIRAQRTRSQKGPSRPTAGRHGQKLTGGPDARCVSSGTSFEEYLDTLAESPRRRGVRPKPRGLLRTGGGLHVGPLHEAASTDAPLASSVLAMLPTWLPNASLGRCSACSSRDGPAPGPGPRCRLPESRLSWGREHVRQRRLPVGRRNGPGRRCRRATSSDHRHGSREGPADEPGGS